MAAEGKGWRGSERRRPGDVSKAGWLGSGLARRAGCVSTNDPAAPAWRGHTDMDRVALVVPNAYCAQRMQCTAILPDV